LRLGVEVPNSINRLDLGFDLGSRVPKNVKVRAGDLDRDLCRDARE